MRKVIGRLLALLSGVVLLGSNKIEQVGQYLRFESCRQESRCKSEYSFKLFIAGYSLDDSHEGVLEKLEFYTELLRENEVHSVSENSQITINRITLASINEGLFVYSINISVVVVT